MSRNTLWAKISALEFHQERIKEKRNVPLEIFLKDLDRQESVLFNLQMAVQNCIDMAAHLVSEQRMGLAGSTNELFYLLEERGVIDPEMTERMVRAVGFRNVLVHEYGKIDLEFVFRAAHENLDDLMLFSNIVAERFG
ncbi:type VII toxin-antitoxin system HepT family RNase toxin [Desulfonatronum thioautotrophicum]|uniref:type VII toxin-antitoxin system HepT family RNase toxin n=1 Tax=Desulfonatronum thioautotrophicum TaxID=617001 RepID=UPI000AB99BAC|nr:DUF86 domain-containing protein [Desulfonatronum thioautotrophicum]